MNLFCCCRRLAVLQLKFPFNSWLNSAGVVSCTNEFDEMKPARISNEDYEHFMEMWERSGSKTLGDLTEFYVKVDTLQLADVFENFIDVCMEKYGLDPSYYVTAAHLAYDAMLKVTGAEIELLTVLKCTCFLKKVSGVVFRQQ